MQNNTNRQQQGHSVPPLPTPFGCRQQREHHHHHHRQQHRMVIMVIIKPTYNKIQKKRNASKEVYTPFLGDMIIKLPTTTTTRAINDVVVESIGNETKKKIVWSWFHYFIACHHLYLVAALCKVRLSSSSSSFFSSSYVALWNALEPESESIKMQCSLILLWGERK